ncbi:cobyrinate a,c-diamide synthase [Desulfosarcina widdelii]|nr:cobyrinate a,c-diamide synthase [Desulfosarcina widdelii]
MAATHSGAGKTTLTLGLMAALRRRGLAVAPFKVGPDFIDPGHHTVVAGRESRNLDGWMLDRAANQAIFQRHTQGCDVAVVEGVMGLFDGFSGTDEAGSTAQMAKWLDLPVLLVVNAASMARSAAALVQGFERFDPGLRFAGLVFNNLGSDTHLRYLKDAVDACVKMPLMGGLLRNDQLEMPERHLGLTTADDRPLTEKQLDRLADHIEAGLELDRLLETLPEIRAAGERPLPADRLSVDRAAPVRARLGIARDRAFCFYYTDNLDLLAAAGLELVPFSPLEDRHLPEDLDGIYIGGGYPELHAERLSQNQGMREAIYRSSRKGMPIYAECGGFMYLCRDLRDTENRVHPMCNCFAFRSRMHTRLRTLGYREVCFERDSILGKTGQVVRGHEFHYSDLDDADSDRETISVYSAASRRNDGRKSKGYLVNRTLGSYIHLHFQSLPACARSFADACRKYRKSRRAADEAP